MQGVGAGVKKLLGTPHDQILVAYLDVDNEVRGHLKVLDNIDLFLGGDELRVQSRDTIQHIA